MTIGVPKEIKIGETRVSMTPSLCRRCVSLGAKVLIQKSAGLTAGFTDAEYRAAGASLVPDAAKVWRSADLILKVKEPLPAEYALMQDGRDNFHLPAPRGGSRVGEGPAAKADPSASHTRRWRDRTEAFRC
jgi:alanine dehydrogenase